MDNNGVVLSSYLGDKFVKLLTIEIEDKFSRGLEKITEEVENTLHDEAYLRGWAPGYKLNPIVSVKTLDNQEVVYTFVVEGSYENDNDLVAGDTIVSSQGLSEQTDKVLSILTPREEKVLRMRFGIGEKTDHTLEEVVMGEKMDNNSVDLGELVAGDTIVLRDGTGHTVKVVRVDRDGDYEVITRTERRHSNTFYNSWYHGQNGGLVGKENCPGDIVDIIKHDNGGSGEKMNLAKRFKALAKERQFEQAAEARNSVEYIEIIENLAEAAEYGNDEYYGNTLMSLGVKLALELDGFHVYRDPNGLYFRVCFGLGGSDE
jgi:hypothetical protein